MSTTTDALPAATVPPRQGPDSLRQFVSANARRWRRLARVRVAFVAGFVLLGAGLVLWQPARFWRAAARVLLPLARVEPAYRTNLVVEPGDVEAAGDVILRISIQGERPETLTILT